MLRLCRLEDGSEFEDLAHGQDISRAGILARMMIKFGPGAVETGVHWPWLMPGLRKDVVQLSVFMTVVLGAKILA